MWILTLLLLAGSDSEEAVSLPEWSAEGVTVQATVRVEEPIQPGLARVCLQLQAEGPPGLLMEEPQLEDARAAWRVRWQISAWNQDDQSFCERLLLLEQTKPGTVPLPGIRLRVRPPGRSDWLEASWPEPLQQPVEASSLLLLPEPAVSSWQWLWIGVLLSTLLALGGYWMVQYWRRQIPKSDPLILARARLEDTLSQEPEIALPLAWEMVLQLLEEGGLPARRLTSQELLAALPEHPLSPSTQEGLCEVIDWVDRIKYAGEKLPPATWSALRIRLRELLEQLWERQITGSGKSRESSSTG